MTGRLFLPESSAEKISDRRGFHVTNKVYDHPMFAAVLNFGCIWAVYLGMEGFFSLVGQTFFTENAFRPVRLMIIGACSLIYAAVGYVRTKKEQM